MEVDEIDDDLKPVGNSEAWRDALPPSQQWLAEAEGHQIPTSRVSTEEERDLFKDNYRRFLTGGSSSQNSHDAYDYDAFAMWWNERVEALEQVCEGGQGYGRFDSLAP